MLTLKSPRNILTYAKTPFAHGVSKEKSNIPPQKVVIDDTYSPKHQNKQIKSKLYTQEFLQKNNKKILSDKQNILKTNIKPMLSSLTSVVELTSKEQDSKKILEGVFKGNITEVVVAHRDRFTRVGFAPTRFGYSLFEWIFKQHQAILICDQKQGEEPTNELSEDLMSIITVFTARYYGKRKYKHRNTVL